MLNELHDLWQACIRANISLPVRIPGLDEGQNAEGLRVYLKADKTIDRIEPVSAEGMRRIRKWKCGEGITLPVFNFEPLHALSEPEYKDFKSRMVKALKGQDSDLGFLKETRLLRWKTDSQSRYRKLDGAFKNVSTDLLSKIRDDKAVAGEAWRALLVILRELPVERFLPQLAEAVRQRLLCEKPDDCSFDLLFHNQAKAGLSTVPIQFEPAGIFATPIYSHEAQDWLIGILAKSVAPESEDGEENTGEATDDTAGTDKDTPSPVWGTASGCSAKYREVKLPVLGKASLFNRDVNAKPTSIRYDIVRPIFPVGQEVRMKLMAAVEWLAAEERQGKTWAVRAKFQKPDKKTKKPPPFLLLLYLDQKADAPLHLADLFAGPPGEESDRTIVEFETVCTDVAQGLDGIPGVNAQAQVKLFALHKPDGYRAQIFCSESFTAPALKQLAAAWQADCRKHPAILLPQFPLQTKEEAQRQKEMGIKSRPEPFPPSVPFPYQAVECLNTIWQKCEDAKNAKADPAADLDLSDAFELLRRTGYGPTDVDYLSRVLELAVRRALPLLSAVGQAMHQTNRKTFAALGDRGRHQAKSVLHARRWPCILALLLTRLGYELNTETTMKETAFLIGRFLAQLDRLHAYYAKYVSGKDEGLRQLLGNSLMAVALESPLRAFELAGQRMLPYQAWAEQFSRGRDSFKEPAKRKDAGFVGAILWDLGRIAEDLAERGIPETARDCLPQRQGHEDKPPTKPILDLAETLRAQDYAWMHADPAAKAQMMLGYLARPPKKEAAPQGEGVSSGSAGLPDFAGEVGEAQPNT